MAYLLQQLANALPLAALYAALAFGYSIAFALTRRADITYGAIFAFSGHLYLLVAHTGWDMFRLTLPAALSMAAVFAILGGIMAALAAGRFVMRPLSAVSPNAVIVASVAVLMVLMEAARLTSGSRELWLPPFISDPVVLWRDAGVTVSLTRLQLINVTLMLGMIGGGAAVLHRTRWGRMWRAVSDDPLAAELSGTDTERVFTIAYAGAALFACICGVLATSHFGTMDFGAGLFFGLKIVLIAAVGSHLHPLRSAAGAAVVGLGETLWSGYGPIFWRDLAVLSALVIIMVSARQERPIP